MFHIFPHGLNRIKFSISVIDKWSAYVYFDGFVLYASTDLVQQHVLLSPFYISLLRRCERCDSLYEDFPPIGSLADLGERLNEKGPFYCYDCQKKMEKEEEND